MRTHPAADLFPMMGEAELAELTKDIEAHGQRVPIVTYRGEILDGRSRFQACMALDKLPRTVEWDGVGSPTAFAWSMNGSRRHMTPSQKAAVAVEMLPLLETEARQRQRQAGEQFGEAHPKAELPARLPEALPGESRERAAAVVGVSSRYVSEAKRLKADQPDLYERVKEGAITLPEAKRVREMREDKAQAEVVGRGLEVVGDENGHLERATWKRIYREAVVAVGNLHPLSPEAVAGIVSDGDFASLQKHIDDLGTWFQAVKTARSSGIRLLTGGRS